MSFTDITGHWAAEAIAYVYEHGMMTGTSANTFSPDLTMDRAMMATILYRMAGAPAVTSTNPFTDVEEDTWYTDAVIWANARGIIRGVGGSCFAPSVLMTREQMVAMLYRYAQYEKMDVTASADLTGYTDQSEVSDWALYAMQWAVAEGLITGRTADTVAPGAGLTRAEAAEILMRFDSMNQ